MTTSPFSGLFSTKGRMRRLHYSLLILTITVVVMAIVLVGLFAFPNPDYDPEEREPGVSPLSSGAIILVTLVYLVSLPITLIAGIKRLKDTDNSPWMILLTLVPVLGLIMALYMLFAEGTIGPNKYGPDPKRPDLGMPGGAEPFDWQKAVNS